MELLEQAQRRAIPPEACPATVVVDGGERAARRALRAQIARLERELSDAFVTAFEMGGLDQARVATAASRGCSTSVSSSRFATSSPSGCAPRVRDRAARPRHRRRTGVLLERMLLEPGKYRFVRIARSDLGEPGCGVWQVRPRLGLIGMLMGWWQVKLSSGCPLAGGRGADHGP